MESLKVFELAKKMGMETIALMDKLREFKIPVKNHMAELDSSTVEKIESRFAEERAKVLPKTTSKARKRTVAPKTAAGPQVVKAGKPSAIAPTSKTASKTAPARKSSAPTRTTPTVIRRKANTPDLSAESPTKVASTGARIVGRASLENLGLKIVPLESSAQAERASEEETGDEKQATSTLKSAAEPQPSDLLDRHGNRKAQVIARIDLKQTAPEPKIAPGRQEHADDVKIDREEMGRLIKQEALAQAKKAAAHARETKIEDFNASDFRKRELLFQPKKKKIVTNRPSLKTMITTPSAEKRKIKLQGGITVSKLAQEMGVKTNAVIAKLMSLGTMARLNDVLDFETAQILAQEYKFEVENVERSLDDLIKASAGEDNPEDLVTRPPVVTVMGHVDHGKTSLLDAIRKTKVAAGEAGGITQHIGAYSVEINGRQITFLDTPGHEAFTAMRARGAKATDIVILVVAADDGIMPQTREAIIHAKSAGVPIIVAVNKIDLPGANPQKVLQGLTEFELVPEEWGGSTIVAKVSAIKGEGIPELLEMILLQADVLELKANPTRPATGVVIEARLDRGRGPVATLLIQEGRIKTGDVVAAGTAFGRVRAMLNDRGQKVAEVLPGFPVEILGLSGVPAAGDHFVVAKDESIAAEIVDKRKEQSRANVQPTLKMSLEDLFSKVQQADVKELPLLIKADVQGSAEALKDTLSKQSTEKVKVKILSAGVGGISESDVLLASASHAIIIGFNVRPETGVGSVAEREGVEIKTYSIIYDIVDDIKKAMTGLLAPKTVEKSMGRAEVRNTFNIPKVGTIAGCSVLEGKVTRQALVRLLRDSKVVYEGKLSSLKRFKDDVREVLTGYECGIGIENYNDVKVGDVIEAFVKEQVAETL